MLEDMRIRGLGVIDDAVLEFGPGLTVVTGETGAGKTMVVQGLSLLFGGRAEASRVRPGNGRALVEGRLVLAPGHAALDRAVAAGAELDEGALLLRRSVASDGRSRAHLGGAAVPVGVLGQLAEHVLAVHGQSDQHRLLQPAQQRAALDRHAGPAVLELRDRFAADWARWRQGRATLEQLRADAVERHREAGSLRRGLAEVEAAGPEPGEGRALISEIERLAHADDLRAAAAAGQQALTGDETSPDGVEALSLVVSARRRLESAAGHDAQLGLLAARLTEVGHLLTDVAGELASYLASVDADPARLSAAQERLAVLTTLVRRYGAEDTDGVLAWAQQASDRLLELDGTQDQIAELEQQDVELEGALGKLAAELSAARIVAAREFGAAVTAELVGLAMPHAAVHVAVSSRELLAATAAGVDDVEMLLTPHPGSLPRPLHKGASGGELSRVMLAVEVVFAGSDPVPLLVFDEVDAGVGGRAAVEVGRCLARLARDHQVVVVTHLPQVAAFADRHLLVVKADDGTVTTSGVVSLEGSDRVAELSRMLAGVDTGLARGHAEELLAVAAEQRHTS